MGFATSDTGSIIQNSDYLPYGPPSPQQSAVTDPDFGFTGHLKCPFTGLTLAPYRVLGYANWLSRDPIGEQGGLNLYGYVANNPINLWDPFGLDVVMTLGGMYMGNAVNASEFAGGRERGRMPSAYGNFQVNPDKPEAALPARLPNDQRDVDVSNPANGQNTQCKVTDVGPWNTRDRYWETGQRPLAEGQFANETAAQNGQVPGQNAGIDLTPAAMNALGFKGPENTRQGPVVWSLHGEAFSGFYPAR